MVGDWVFLKVHPYRPLFLAKRKNEKLAPKFFGMYQNEEKLGIVAYRLRLPNEATIHPVFHVFQLKCALGVHQRVFSGSSLLTDAFEWIVEPCGVYGYHMNVNLGTLEVLIA